MTSPTPSDRPIDEIADRYVEDFIAGDPVSATMLGLPGHDSELKVSPDGFAAQEHLARRALSDMSATTLSSILL